MIVVKIFKDNAKRFANTVSAITFENCRRRLRLYFSDLEKVKDRIIKGEIVNTPYATFQKDRRVKVGQVRDERRKETILE